MLLHHLSCERRALDHLPVQIDDDDRRPVLRPHAHVNAPLDGAAASPADAEEPDCPLGVLVNDAYVPAGVGGRRAKGRRRRMFGQRSKRPVRATDEKRQ